MTIKLKTVLIPQTLETMKEKTPFCNYLCRIQFRFFIASPYYMSGEEEIIFTEWDGNGSTGFRRWRFSQLDEVNLITVVSNKDEE